MIALYSRVSTAAQAEDGYSIDAQQERLVAYCTAIGKKEYQFYTDAGYSGSNLNRPAIQNLIEDAKKGKVETVIVFKLDRLSRSQKDTLYLIEEVFEKNGVSFISLTESFDTNTPFGKAMIGLLSVFAQLERENIYIRTREGLRKRVESGLWRGGKNPPKGYRYEPSKNELIIIPEEAERVKQAFELYLSGKSPAYIANALGFTSDVVVTNMLKKPVYKGYVTLYGKEYKGQHEAIITEEVFERTQEMMKQRSTNKTPEERNVNLLSGLIFCGVCGTRMRYVKWGENSPQRIMCYSKDKSKTVRHSGIPCDMPAVLSTEIESVVLSDLFGMKVDTGDNSETSFQTDTLEILKNEIERKKQAINNLYSLYAKKPDDAILHMIDEEKEAVSQLEKKIELESKYRSKAIKNSEVIEKIASVRKIWSSLTPKQKQRFVRSVIERIEISKSEINILYKFDEFDIDKIKGVA